MKSIVIATDLTQNTEPAIVFGVTLARDLHVEAILVHAWEPPAFMMLDIALTTPPAQVAEQVTRLQHRLDEVTAQHQSEGVRVSSRLLEGPAAATIVTAARELDARFIVVGSVTPRTLSRLLGSTADAIVREAQCPVLLVHAHPH
jgi:nucleotide-binding universal stress UspA family protein